MSCNITYIGTDYFEVLGIPLVAGRDINEQDRFGTQKVAVMEPAPGPLLFW